MSDFQQASDWWQASDGKWYPPESRPGAVAQPPPVPAAPQAYGAPQPGAGQWAQAPYQQYGGQGTGQPSVQGLAVASMVLGIVAVVFCWCWYVGGVCAIVGLPMGAIALSKISKGEADPGPKGMAIAGVATSIVALALIILVVVAFASTFSWTT